MSTVGQIGWRGASGIHLSFVILISSPLPTHQRMSRSRRLFPYIKLRHVKELDLVGTESIKEHFV
jgi:hypothetical protein